jgi:DNA-binding CsgD family transcriptional regulator
MKGKAVWMRTADRVVNYINEYVTVAGAEKREEVLQLFDNMHQLFPHWVMMTCPVMHPNIQYISKNSPHIFGCPKEYLINNSNIAEFFSMVHDADQEDLHSCFSFIHDLLELIPPEEHDQYRTVYHYRFRKSNGQYIYLYDEKAVLCLSGSGNLYYALFRDITSERAFSGVKAEVFKQERGVLKKIKEYKPSAERNALSKREVELVTLIKQGLSTKEIAYYLNISHNTVRNIKSRLFEKYNVNNTVELLNMTA